MAPSRSSSRPSPHASPRALATVDIQPLEHQARSLSTARNFVASADDILLSEGIADYTFVKDEHSKNIRLGKGKFSFVLLAKKRGKLVRQIIQAHAGKKRLTDWSQYAIKHTPLYPHHPLIAQRLLREPNLLARTPRHANLIAVYESIRTPDHFYLVGQLSSVFFTPVPLLKVHGKHHRGVSGRLRDLGDNSQTKLGRP
jgi:hypothetical protein